MTIVLVLHLKKKRARVDTNTGLMTHETGMRLNLAITS